jgi:hypothetical protein
MFIFQNQIDDDSTILSFFDSGLMLWCLTPHSTIYRDGQFYWHVVKTTGVTSGAGIKHPDGASA